MKALLILLLVLLLILGVVLAALKIAKATRLWPAAILIVTAPLEVYRSSSSAGANVSLFRLALLLSLAAFSFDLLRRRMRFPSTVPVVVLIYAALVAWQLVSLLFVTANPSLAHRLIGQYLSGLTAAFLICCYVRRSDLRVAAALCAGATVIPLAAGAFRVLSVSSGGSGDLPGLTELPLNLAIEATRQSGSFLLDGTQRLNATFSDPNHFGFYIGTALLVGTGAACGAVFGGKPTRFKSVSSQLLLLVAAAVALLGSYSRSAWVLAAVGVGVMAALFGRAFWTRQRVIAAGVLAVLALALATPLILSRLSTGEPGNTKSTQVHVHTLRTALELAAHHPLVGVGLGGYGRYVDEPSIISSAVSTYLTVVAELGVLGLALLLAAILVTSIAAVRSVVRGPPEDRMILAGLVAAFVALAVANTIYEVWLDDFQWVLFGLVLALTVQPRVRIGLAPFRVQRDQAGEQAAASGSEQAQVVA